MLTIFRKLKNKLAIIFPKNSLLGGLLRLFYAPIKIIKNEIFTLHQNYLFKTAPQRHQRAIKKITNKKKIKIAFFVIHSAVWKCDLLYQLLLKDSLFELVVVVCPYVKYGEMTMLSDMEECFNYFQNKNYNVIKTLRENGKWLDVKKEINPDIIFFTNPHELTKEEYYIRNFLNYLTCYVPYGINQTHLDQMHFNKPFVNFLWLFFLETGMQKNMSEKFAFNKGINAVVSGYPVLDYFFDKNYIPKDVWKVKDRHLKRIIWAPHHTLHEPKSFLSLSNFLEYDDFMFELATNMQDKIQVSFKPHPLLKAKLYVEEGWGKKKTDEYYDKWQDLPNGQLNDSEYIDLFLTSDAMILDSGSFLSEYLTVNKPSLYQMRYDDLENQFNEYGKMAFSNHYHSKNKEDVLHFVNEIVIAGNDFFEKSKREIY